MTSEYPNIKVKQEYCDDDSNYASHNFWDYQLAFNDFQEDASTQTDSFTAFKSIISSPNNQEVPAIPVAKLETNCFHSPPLRRANHSYKNKSPNTVKVLMEKHRVNERLRHHCLNEQLYMICRIVPGFTDEGKETKVVMMQRIISYIAYLENSIRHLSRKLNTQPDPTSQLLAHGVKDMDWSNYLFSQNEFRQEGVAPIVRISHCVATAQTSQPVRRYFANSFFFPNRDRDSQVSTLSVSRRLKLSSPTIDSTTDFASQESVTTPSSSVPTSQADSSQMSDISIKVETCDRVDNAVAGTTVDWLHFNPEKIEVFTSQDQFDSIFENSSFGQPVFQAPTSSFEEGVVELEMSEVEWLGSPDTSIKVLLLGKMENFGIKTDPDLNDDPAHEFSCVDIVSPDQVLQQSSVVKTSVKRKRTDSTDVFESQELTNRDSCGSYLSSQENVIIPETVCRSQDVKIEIDWDEYQVVPNSSDNKKKPLTPRRQPFVDVINAPNVNESETFYQVEESTGIPMASNFMEVESSMEETGFLEDEECQEEALQRVKSKVLEEAWQLTSTAKIDLRKSSWLNGFMMYSQVHRRRFIRDNPGVHTAQISKLMGQVWREMSKEGQQVYRDHAKLCSQELQKVLDRKLTKHNDPRTL